jgi:hypothetical protein
MALSKTYVLPDDPRMGYSNLDATYRREFGDLTGIHFEDGSQFPTQSPPIATSQSFDPTQGKTTCI